MRRIQFVELEDLPWMPHFIRKGITDFLELLWRAGIPRKKIASRLAAALKISGDTRVVDLCSGGGGPWKKLAPALREQGMPVRVVLTDLFPNTDALMLMEKEGKGSISFSRQRVDAAKVPEELSGFRTIFGAFHHMLPETARAILADAANHGRGIAIFEVTRRSWFVILACLGIPALLCAVTPFIRPFSWSRLFWTYALPVIPLALLFDSVMSCLRTYTEEDLRRMTAGLGGEGYTWEIGVDLQFPYFVPILRCMGVPGKTLS
ncbi:MAG: class I SAM-dependent methyltransferase [Thermodesulfobacteriota bacterium]